MIDPGLTHRVILVTGSNHGIGAAMALAFTAQSAKVIIHYLEQFPPEAGRDYQALHVVKGRPAADALVERIRAQGGEAVAISGDLTDPATSPALFDFCERTFGPVEVLVNNAAHCEEPDTIFTTSSGSLERTFAVNTRAAVLLISEMARRRQGKRSWGRVINISTDAAQTFAGQIAYGASKAAMEAFTRSLAIELGPLGITVNTIAPGPVQTGWMTEELLERELPKIPLGRVGLPEDIADAAVFLASDQAGWLTGQVIKVSGGHNL